MQNKLKFSNKYIQVYQNKIDALSSNINIIKISKFLIDNYGIDVQIDQDIIKPFTRDWSNIPGGKADFLVRPKTAKECAIILRLCKMQKIPLTISAGQTNLTGSATPKGGMVLSTSYLKEVPVSINIENQSVRTSVGIPLEEMRNKILKSSNNKLYYPVDPTSRHDAYVGGTLSCNASGFIPGEKGATRYWVQEIEFILLNGYSLNIKRGDYISKNGEFILECGNELITLPIPQYKRPNIKNASGPFSSMDKDIDFIDLIIGSEGIFGLITECKFNLDKKPKSSLELFLRLKNEEEAINLHQFLYDYFNNDMSKLTALEYFGYNCYDYMKNKNFLFNNKEDVGIYIQVPVDDNIDVEIADWSALLLRFNPKFNLDNIIVLNDPMNWKRFFEARHSIPDNALMKTRQLGGISIITDTIVPMKNFKKYLEKIHCKLQDTNIEYLLFGHLGDCHLHFHLIPSPEQNDLSLEVYDYMVDLSTKFGGVYSAEHGTGKRKKNDFKKCYGNDAVEMVRKAKLAVDPDFLLNNGNVI